jgi:hypothetical protein
VFTTASVAQICTVALASVNLDGTASGRGKSTSPILSPDGRYVAFTSQASDLVANDTNGFTDVFLRDLTAGTTLLLSVNFTGSSSGRRLSANPVLSADGNVVVFESYSSDLTVGDFNEGKDIFVFRLSAGDSDGDGMADDWEVAYFGVLSREGIGDFDDDGQSDLAEFRAGTNPTDNHSIFRAFTLSNPNVADGVMVLWNAVPGAPIACNTKMHLKTRTGRSLREMWLPPPQQAPNSTARRPRLQLAITA